MAPRQNSAPPTHRSETEVRAEMAAQILAQRNTRIAAGGADSRRAAAGRPTITRRIAAAPAPPPSINHPLYAAEALAVAGGIAYYAHAAPWWFVAGGAAAAVVNGATTHFTLRYGATPTHVATTYAVLGSLAAGGVLAVDAQSAPWSGPGFLALAGSAVVLAPAYGLIRRRHDKHNEKEMATWVAARTQQKRHDWEKILHDAGAADVRIVSELSDETWTAGERTFPAGFALALELGEKSPEGKALQGIASKVEELAARRLKLPIRGGSIQIVSRGYAHEYEMIVPTRDILREDVPFILEAGPRSVNDPIYVAMAVDGTALGVDFMETPHGMVVGMTDHGKSVFLNSHAVELTRCTDNVTWMICGRKPNRLFTPWLEAFLLGTPDPDPESPTGFIEPVLDWVVGNDIEEACRVLLDLYKAIAVRQAMAGKGGGDEKWIPSPRHPRIALLIDEVPDLMENQTYKVKPYDWTGDTVEDDEKNGRMTGFTFSELILKLVRLARSEGITVVFCTQRATNTMTGPDAGDIKTQLAYRVSVRQAGASEAARTFLGETMGINVAALGKGEIFMETNSDLRPTLGKGYYTTWDVIRAASIAHVPYAQPLDPETAGELDFYAERWTRASQQAFLRTIVADPVRTIPGRPLNRTEIKPSDDAIQIPDVSPGVAVAELAELDTSVDALRDLLPDLAGFGPNSPDSDDSGSESGDRFRAPWGARIDPTLPQDTRALLDLIASSDLMYARWIPSRDVIRLAASELGWPDSDAAGGARVRVALERAGIEQPRSRPRIDGRRMTSGYWTGEIKKKLDFFLRKSDDDDEGDRE